MSNLEQEHDVEFEAECIDGTQRYRDALIEAGHLKGLTTNQQERKELYDGLSDLQSAHEWFTNKAKELIEARERTEAERNRLRLMQLELCENKDGNKPPSLVRIADLVASKHSVTVGELRSDCKTTDLATARQEGYYLSRKYTTLSFAQIGKFFNKDHSTVVHGVNRHKERMEAV